MSERSEWYADVESNGQQRNVNLWGLLQRRKWFILLGMIVGLALGYLYYVQAPRVFQSTARILISNSQSKLALAGIDPHMALQWDRQAVLSTQAMLIRSPLVVQMALAGVGGANDEALDNLAEKIDRELGEQEQPIQQETHTPRRSLLKLRTLAGDAQPAITVIEGLRVEPAAERAEVLDLTYRCKDPDDCRVILDAVIASYKSYLKGKHNSLTKETYKLIEKAKNDLSDELVRKEQAYRDFRSRNAAQLFKGAEGRNIHQERLWQIERERSAVLLRRSQITAELAAIEAAEKGGLRREVLMMMVFQNGTENNSVENYPIKNTTSSIEKELLPLMLEERRLLQYYGPDHRDVVSIRERIATTREVLNRVAAAEYQYQDQQDNDQDLGPPKQADRLHVYLDSLRQQIATLSTQEQELGALFQLEQAAATSLERLEVQDEGFRSEIERKQTLFGVVVKRLEEINLTEDLGGSDATQIWAASRGEQVEPSLARVMAVAGFLGVLAGFGLAFAVELADKRFLNPLEIQRDLGLPLFGHIPLIGSDVGDIAPDALPAPILCTYHHPHAAASEAYRAVRTSLYFSTHGEGHKVVQITSPSPDDGKTTLALNLAISIAQSNKRVLLLDADFRRPSVHKLLGIGRQVGLSSAVNGQIEIPDAIQASEIENLSVMACGPRVNNPSELLTSPLFEELLSVVREQFDFVIVDSPPLLAVTDPSVIAARVDGVLLTLRLTKNARTRALHAAEMLSALDANVLGVVVNGVSKREGYGAYYDYTYGFSYAKTYAYGERSESPEDEQPSRKEIAS